MEKCHMTVVHLTETSTASSSVFADASSFDDKDFSSFQDDSKAPLVTLNIKNMSYRGVSNKYTIATFDVFNAILCEGYKSDSNDLQLDDLQPDTIVGDRRRQRSMTI
ncbi:hypothetical protein HELRODRAFT_171820 [Helobdella robusta]|uniref:Uncharacterized protein n=1 Tax=Helobdella robusta TaxID=6412 RepID=T1F4Q8_HELRO|nr:hypothetical protein HELRODRAFT_171820 [Helobdella robusta]ESO05421.1 hypothetical protein HELRODRAFT_171820 [Helobdella robusta]